MGLEQAEGTLGFGAGMLTNVALTGGVALNSVLNGRILREMGFDNVFVPPGCGDEGTAAALLYCCIFLVDPESL